MSEFIAPTDFIAVMQESFDRGQMLTFTPTGSSMMPMLDGKSDKVTFAPMPDRLRKYDVAFYMRPDSGQLVLHRMIGFTASGGYIFCGDNQYELEYGIRDDDVLALMIVFTHRGKEHQVTDLSYRLYVRCLMLKKRLHRILSKVYHFIKDKFQ